jgi:hypothetical protein
MAFVRRSSRLGVSGPLFICLIALAVSTAPSLAQSENALLGTWRLNVQKSKYSPGPAPKSNILTYSRAATCVMAVNEAVSATGAQTRTEFSCITPDGRSHPVKGSPSFDSSAYKRIDEFTTQITRSRAGKVVETGTRALAKDGKTLTIALQGTDVKGQKYSNVAIYEKQ